MGWFDRFAYTVSPLFGPIGKGIADNVQDLRYSDAAKQIDAARNLQDFAVVPQPTDIYGQENLYKLDTLRDKRLKELQEADAAARLDRFKDEYKRQTGTSNLRFLSTPEERAELMKSGLSFPDLSANPKLAEGMYALNTQAQNQNTMSDVFAQGQDGKRINPDLLSFVATNKDLSGQFENTTQGVDRMWKEGAATKQRTARDAMNKVIADFPLKRDVASWNEFATRLRSIPNVDPEEVNKTLNDIAKRNQGPVGVPLQLFAQSGDATTRGSVQTDMFGNPLAETKTTVTNHPRQPREQKEPPSEKRRRADLAKINALKLKRGLVKVEPEFPDAGKAQQAAYDDAIAMALEQYNQDYPDYAIDNASSGEVFKGDPAKHIGTTGGKPQVLETKVVNGKTYYRLGNGPRDWTSVKP